MARVVHPTIKTSLDIEPRIYSLLREHRIKIIDAFRIGAAIALAERGVQEYDNELNLFRRMKEWQMKAESLMKKYEMHSV